MSKLLNWGHWIVAAFFAAWGTLELIMLGLELTHRYTVRYAGTYFDLETQVLEAAIALACAWGIWKWQRWGQYLALFQCAIAVFALSFGIYFTRGTELNIFLVLAELISVSITAWLLLPAARAEYKRRSIAI